MKKLYIILFISLVATQVHSQISYSDTIKNIRWGFVSIWQRVFSSKLNSINMMRNNEIASCRQEDFSLLSVLVLAGQKQQNCHVNIEVQKYLADRARDSEDLIKDFSKQEKRKKLLMAVQKEGSENTNKTENSTIEEHIDSQVKKEVKALRAKLENEQSGAQAKQELIEQLRNNALVMNNKLNELKNENPKPLVITRIRQKRIEKAYRVNPKNILDKQGQVIFKLAGNNDHTFNIICGYINTLSWHNQATYDFQQAEFELGKRIYEKIHVRSSIVEKEHIAQCNVRQKVEFDKKSWWLRIKNYFYYNL